MIGDHLVEIKGLKQVERKGLKKDSRLFIKLSLFHGSIKQSYFNWVSTMVLWRDRLCPCVDAAQCVGEPSTWLGWLNKDGDLRTFEVLS